MAIRLRESQAEREARFERVRERLDEAMLRNPATAHHVRAEPLSKKYQRRLMRRVK